MLLATLFYAAILFGALDVPAADLDEQRRQFRTAVKALAAGNIKKSQQLEQGLQGYPLYPYFRYENLRCNLHRAKRADVQAFLTANEDTAMGEALRTRWLERLARRQHWKTFLQDYQPQRAAKLQCAQLLARVRTKSLEGVLRDAIPLWMIGESQDKLCDPVFALLYKSPLMTEELLWQRIRLTIAAGNTSLAGYLARKLPPPLQRWVTLWRQAHRDPARILRNKALATDTPEAREVAVHAVTRLARRNLNNAIKQWQKVRTRYSFSTSQRAAVERALALRAVTDDHDQQIALHDAITDEFVDVEIQRSRLRAGIRTQDWAALARWTKQQPAADMNVLRWDYWRARAADESGDIDTALQIYRRLSNERDYYGFRAADRLKVAYKMVNRPVQFNDKDVDELVAVPGMARAREFYLVDRIYEGRREWLYETRRMDSPRQQELAAVLAHQLGWHDRAIMTLGKARLFDDLAIRFPLSHQTLVEKYAKKHKLPQALLFSIIRAESAFMEDARSPSGALGLMQVMPATGRETAQAIGYKLANSRQLLNAKPNVTIGSAYLQQMMKRFNGNVAMAAAAYNAGPHRVRAWQPRKSCMRAEDWIELIPFNETRRYVRRALFYTAIYQWRMAQTVDTLDSRLAAIPARRSPKGASCTV